MERLHYRRVRVAALSFLVLGLSAVAATGCGGGSNPSSTTAAEPPPAESTAAPGGASKQAGESTARGSGSQQHSSPAHPFQGRRKGSRRIRVGSRRFRISRSTGRRARVSLRDRPPELRQGVLACFELTSATVRCTGGGGRRWSSPDLPGIPPTYSRRQRLPCGCAPAIWKGPQGSGERRRRIRRVPRSRCPPLRLSDDKRSRGLASRIDHELGPRALGRNPRRRIGTRGWADSRAPERSARSCSWL